MRNAIAIAMLSILAGCQSAPVIVHEPVTVEHYVFVPIDKALTAPCPVAMPRDNSVAEVLRVARERRASLEGCANPKLSAIGALQGSPVKDAPHP